jgi:hypothetical protein
MIIQNNEPISSSRMNELIIFEELLGPTNHYFSNGSCPYFLHTPAQMQSRHAEYWSTTKLFPSGLYKRDGQIKKCII